MISILRASKYICEAGDWTVSNLMLQKILYLSQMIYMGRNDGDRLISSGFEAWDYGPVSPVLYGKMKAFGPKPIPNVFKGVEMPTGKELELLTQAGNALLSKTPSELVAYTHQKGGAWEKNYIAGVYGISIPDADILNEYRYRYS